MIKPNKPVKKTVNSQNKKIQISNNSEQRNEIIRNKSLVFTQSNLRPYTNTNIKLLSFLKNVFKRDEYTRAIYGETVESSKLNQTLGAVKDITKFSFLNRDILDRMIYLSMSGKLNNSPSLEYFIGLNLCFNIEQMRFFNAYNVSFSFNSTWGKTNKSYVFLENSEYNLVKELSYTDYITPDLIEKYPNVIDGINTLTKAIRKPFDNNIDLVAPINYILVPAMIKEYKNEEAYFLFNDLEHKFIFDKLKETQEQFLKQTSLCVVGYISTKKTFQKYIPLDTKAFDYTTISDYEPVTKENKQFVLSLPTDNELFSDKYDENSVFIDALEAAGVSDKYSDLVSAYTEAKQIVLKEIYRTPDDENITVD